MNGEENSLISQTLLQRPESLYSVFNLVFWCYSFIKISKALNMHVVLAKD